MNRRNFLKIAGATAVGTTPLGLSRLGGVKTAAASTLTPRSYGGSDLADWSVVLGDGLYTGPGQTAVNNSDITTEHHGSKSEIKANMNQRGVMAHNITFKRFIDNDAFDFIHTCAYDMRLPYLPTTSSWPHNAQTIEGGLFIWDGGNTRLDYGLAFQWILNPWVSSFGDIRVWSGENGGQWLTSGTLIPDTDWHRIEFVLDVQNQLASIKIDDVPYSTLFSGTPKEGWGTETAARFQAEIISIWPGSNSVVPSHLAEFKDWQWEWNPHAPQ